MKVWNTKLENWLFDHLNLSNNIKPVIRTEYFCEEFITNFVSLSWKLTTQLTLIKNQGQFLLPPSETLSRFFEINCDKNKATFHGVQNMTNLEQHGGF